MPEIPELSLEDLFLDVPDEPETSIPELPVVEDPVDEADTLRGLIVRHPDAFKMRKVRELFTRAFSPELGLQLPNAIDAIDWCAGVCAQPTTAIIVAVDGDPYQDGQLVGLLIADWNKEDLWTLTPWVYHFYSEGLPEIRQAIGGTLREWLQEVGAGFFYGINQTGASDEAYARFLSREFTGVPLASVLQFSPIESE